MFSKRQIIGIDVGSSSYKAVLLEFGEEGAPVVVRDYAIVQASKQEGSLESHLRKLLRKLKTRCRVCAVAVWPQGAKLRIFDAHLEPDLVRGLSHGKPDASALFREELPDYVVDCGRLTSSPGNTEPVKFAAVGMPLAEFKDIERALKKLRYRITLVQLTPLAVLNAFTASHMEFVRKDIFVLANFGHSAMTVVGGSRGTVSSFRTIDIDLTDVPASFVSSEGDGQKEIGPEDEALSAMFDGVADALAHELRRVIESLSAQDDMAQVQQIHVSGVLSNNGILMRKLTEKLSLPCNKWNPFRHISAHRKALRNFTLLDELANLPAAVGAAYQYAA